MRWTKEQLAIHQRRTSSAPVTVEKDLHADIIAELKARRIYFSHSQMHKAHTNGIGTPDFIIAMPGGRTLWCEIKTAKGKLTREQSGVALLLKIANHEHYVVRSLNDFLEIL